MQKYRVIVFEGESAESASRRLRKKLSRESVRDRIRRRNWGAESFQKPGYVRRQKRYWAGLNKRRSNRGF